MRRSRLPPDDPREWLSRAASNLARARTGAKNKAIYLEDLCFDAQQAAEKAIKAVFIERDLPFPYTHDLARLLTLLERAGEPIPVRIRKAERLTRFAVEARYPGIGGPVTRAEYDRVVRLADAVVGWAQRRVAPTERTKRGSHARRTKRDL